MAQRNRCSGCAWLRPATPLFVTRLLPSDRSCRAPAQSWSKLKAFVAPLAHSRPGHVAGVHTDEQHDDGNNRRYGDNPAHRKANLDSASHLSPSGPQALYHRKKSHWLVYALLVSLGLAGDGAAIRVRFRSAPAHALPRNLSSILKKLRFLLDD